MVRSIVSFCAGLLLAGSAIAQAWPEKPVRIVVPLSTGSSSDVLAPAKTPKAVIDRLHADVAAAVQSPEIRQPLENRRIQPVGDTPEQFGRFIQAEIGKSKEAVPKHGIKPE